MLKWILGIAGGIVWCALVFVVSMYVTFPSTAIVERARYEVQKASAGSYALEASGASPWWTGVALHDVRVLSVDKDSGEGAMVIEADSVAARTNLFSLLGSDLPLNAIVDLGGSDMVVDAELDRSENPPKVRRVQGHADSLSVNALGALLAPYGVKLTGSGDVKVDVDMEIADDVKDHDGRISAKGKNLNLTLAMPDPLSGEGEFELGPIAVSNLDIVVDIRNGKATVKKGQLRSDHADVSLSGTLTLNRRLMRSRLRADLVLGELGGQLKAFEGFMSNAKWDDEQFHFRLSCTLDRMNTKCVQPDRKRSSRPSGGTVLPGGDVGNSNRTGSAAGGKTPEELREERRRLREQRLAERRERIANERQPERPGQADDELMDEEDDELLDEEEVDDVPELVMPNPALLDGPDMNLVPPGPGAAVPFPADAPPAGGAFE